MSTVDTNRRLQWEACYNARDVGGYQIEDGRQTRWGALIRSDILARLTPAGCASLVDYGVRTIIDLRSLSELEMDARPFAHLTASDDVPRYLHRPFIDESNSATLIRLYSASTIAEDYCFMLEECKPQVAAIIKAMADAPAGGVLVHCFAGKDRTGLIVALALALVGVPEPVIAADYALTDTFLRPWYDEMLVHAPEDPTERKAWQRQFQALPETMLATLAYLREHFGSVEGYLRSCDLTDIHVTRLRARLLTAG